MTELDADGAHVNSALSIARAPTFLWRIFYISGVRTKTNSDVRLNNVRKCLM